MTPTHKNRGHTYSRAARSWLALLAVLACAGASASAASAAPANYLGSSTDGNTVFFSTSQSLVPGDTDTRRDVYARTFDSGSSQYTTHELSTGPTGGNDAFDATFEGSSADGSKVFFSTDERLTSSDTDNARDVYMRSGGVTTLVSTGPTGGNGSKDADYAGSSADGSVAFFVTAEQLTGSDADASFDIYARDTVANTTKLVSAGAAGCAPICGNGSANAQFRGASADGSKVFFTTPEQLDSSDTDSLIDIYQRDLTTDTTTLLTPGGTCPPNPASCDAIFTRASSDGSKVFFETDERLDPGDTDNAQDVYMRSGGSTTLVSAGGTQNNAADFEGSSADGSKVFFSTAESLDAADTDSQPDVYERSGGSTTLVSTGPTGGNGAFPASFKAAASDGATVVFSTQEQLTGPDSDSSFDLYSRSGGTTTLLSTGPSGGNGNFDTTFAGASPDATDVFFQTQESLVSQDTDSNSDIYEHSAGGTSWVSAGAGSCPGVLCGNGNFSPNFSAVSADGSHAFFVTDERLTSEDLDTETDVYDRSSGGIVLASVGNSVALGPGTPSLTGTNPTSPASSTTPSIQGQSDPNTLVKLYTSTDCSGAPAGSGTDLQLGGSGIQVTVAPDSSTTFHATATDSNGDTSACSSSTVTYQQVANPPAAPTLTGVTPQSPANENHPSVTGSAPAGTSVTIYADPNCTGPAVGSGAADELAGAGIQSTVPDDSTTTFHATATLAGQTSVCSSSSVTFVEDSTAPPAPSLSVAPGSPANDNSPLISGTAESSSSVALFNTADCKGAPVATASAAELAAGLHVQVPDNTTTVFKAVASDSAGNGSPCSAGATYIEDSTPPKTLITFAPGIKTMHRRPVFRFSDASGDSGTSFQCQLDKGPWQPCQAPDKVSRLKRGKHVFRVVGTDVAGNAETTAAVRKFKVVRHR
jgi:hypothetical protein